MEGTPSASSMEQVVQLIKGGVQGAFDIASSAFDFLISNPLAAFIVGAGFAFTALSLIRKAIRVARRA